MPAVSTLTKQEEEREATFAYEDLKKASTPDLKRPFSSVRDACERLLPYHVWAEWEPEELDYTGETDFSPLLAEKWEAWADTVDTRSLSFMAQTERLVETYDRLLKRRVIGEMAGEHLVQNAQLLLQDEKEQLSDLKLQRAQKEKAERERDEARKLWETVQQAQRLVDAAETQKQEASGAGEESGEVKRRNMEIVNHVIGEDVAKIVEGREVYLSDKVEESSSLQQEKKILNKSSPEEDKGIEKRKIQTVSGKGEGEAEREERERKIPRSPQECEQSEDEHLPHDDAPQQIHGQGRTEEREEEEEECEEDGAEQEWAEEGDTLREEDEQMQGSEDEVLEEELLEEEVEEGWDGEEDREGEDQYEEEGDQREGPDKEEEEGADGEEGTGGEGGEREEEEEEEEEAEGEEAEREEEAEGEGEGDGEAGVEKEEKEDEEDEERDEREEDYGVPDDVEGVEYDDQHEGGNVSEDDEEGSYQSHFDGEDSGEHQALDEEIGDDEVEDD